MIHNTVYGGGGKGLEATEYTRTLTSYGWSNYNKKQTVSAEAVTEDSVIYAAPTDDYVAVAGDCGVVCSSFAAGEITFSCDTVPSENITINIFVIDGGEEGEEGEENLFFYNYIESVNATQYIDLGMELVDKTIEVKYQFSNTSALVAWPGIYGYQDGAEPDKGCVWQWSRDNAYYHFINGGVSKNFSLSLNTNTHIIKNTHKYNGVPTIVYDGTTQSHNLTASTNFPSYSAYLFGLHVSGTRMDNQITNLRIYYVKIYDSNNNLTHSFLPCNYNGQIGLWEEINEVFYSNQGTGDFGIG